jgi:Resolvase, N terminal domain
VTDTSKITVSHRERLCLVYIRQSTLAQTRVNTESLERQYELAGLAQRLGWDRSLVRVIDDDLGMSGAEAAGRAGFQDLVAEVALGRVGLIVGLEASRLARSNADWYRLLGAPRGAVYSCGDGRAPPPGRRSGLVKLEAA